LRKVTRITAQKHAALGWLKQLMAFPAFIIARNPIGTVIAIYPLERTTNELWIEYE
jgi:hypothetical protein